MAMQVLNMSCNGTTLTKVIVAAACMPNLLTTDAVLLSGEFQDDKCRGLQVRERCSGEIKALVPTKELNIAKAKGVQVCNGDSIFTGCIRK